MCIKRSRFCADFKKMHTSLLRQEVPKDFFPKIPKISFFAKFATKNSFSVKKCFLLHTIVLYLFEIIAKLRLFWYPQRNFSPIYIRGSANFFLENKRSNMFLKCMNLKESKSLDPDANMQYIRMYGTGNRQRNLLHKPFKRCVDFGNDWTFRFPTVFCRRTARQHIVEPLSWEDVFLYLVSIYDKISIWKN